MSMGITKAELLELLEDVPDHVEIRFASQPNYPIQHHIARDKGAADFVNEVFYLADGGQVHDAPYLPEGMAEEVWGR